MNKNKTIYQHLPVPIRSILIISDGWLVGSSIKSILAEEPVNDYDIIVPVEKWMNTLVSIKQYDHVVNTFGGMKFTIVTTAGVIDLDIWPENIDHFLKVANTLSYVYNINRSLLLKNDL